MSTMPYLVREFGEEFYFDEDDWDNAFDYWIGSEDPNVTLEIIPIENE